MGDAVIKLDNVSKDYNIYKKNIQRINGIFFGRQATEVKHAIKDLSLRIEKNERVLIVGPVESGCSTLLKMIAGVIYPTKGKIRTQGRINAFLDMRAGFENEATCRENIYIKANVIGVPKSVVDEHLEEIIEFANLEDYIDIPFKRAPKGTPLKICLAVHLLKEADIMIIDENFTSGGAYIRKECEDVLVRYFHEHPDMTLVITTNRTGMAKRICTRGILMENGVITMDAPVKETCKQFKEINKQIEKDAASQFKNEQDELALDESEQDAENQYDNDLSKED